jgi:hypothetical protein
MSFFFPFDALASQKTILSMYKLAVKVIDDVNSACAGDHLHSHVIYFYSATVSILDCRDE